MGAFSGPKRPLSSRSKQASEIVDVDSCVDSREAETKSLLCDWLTLNGKGNDVVDVATPILSQGVIDSIQVTELILLVESLSDKPIYTEQLVADSFRDVNAIYACFFK